MKIDGNDLDKACSSKTVCTTAVSIILPKVPFIRRFFCCLSVKSTTCQKEIELLFVLTSSIFFVPCLSLSFGVICHFLEQDFFPRAFHSLSQFAPVFLFLSRSLDLHFLIVHLKIMFRSNKL